MSKTTILRSTLLPIICSTSLAMHAYAADAQRVDVPAGDLTTALESLAKQSGVELVYETQQLKGLRTQGVKGNLSPQEAVTKLLEGTPLILRTDSSGAMLIATPRASSNAGAKSSADGATSQLEPTASRSSRIVVAQNDTAVTQNNSFSTRRAEPTSDTVSPLEEITVTANRREESLHDVPISVSVIDEATMQRSGSLAFQNLADRVPGLTYAANGLGQTRYFIRGVGQFAVNQSPTTGVYFDETPLQVRVTTGYFQPEPIMYDLARVEVLRGPQGTLFGSSSMGGSVRFISKKPDPTQFDASMSAGISATKDSSAESYSLKGMVNIPLLDDKLALRIVGVHDTEGGWLDDVRPLTGNIYENVNRPEAIIEDVNKLRTNAVRIMATYTPTETLRITPTLNFQRARNDANKPQMDDIFGSDARLRARWLDEYAISELFVGNLMIEKDSDVFGGATFLSSTSRLEASLDRLSDLSSLNQPQFSTNRTQVGFYTEQDVEQWTQDFRIVSKSDSPFQYVFGLYYARTETPTVVTNRVVNDWGGGLAPVQRLRQFGFLQTEYAGYGEVSYRYGDFKLAAGGRYFKYQQEDRRFQQRPAGVDFDFAVRGDEDGFSPRVVLSYEPTPTQNYYASYSEGFRTGGVNTPITNDACPAAVRLALGIPDVPPPFKSDKTQNYELGAKLRMLDTVSINTAVYQVDWTEYQQSVSRDCGGSASFAYTGNAGSVQSRGFEAEVVAQVFERMRLTGGVALVDAKFETPVATLGITAGERLWDVPQWVYNAGAEYGFDVTSSLAGAVRVNANHVDETRTALSQIVPAPTRDAYTMVNLSADIAAADWSLTLYVNNLTDISPAYGLDFIPGNGPIPDRMSRVTGRPRTIGLTLSKEF
jgi:iron complex outermembrane recepter protein